MRSFVFNEGKIPGIRSAIIVFPAPGGPNNAMFNMFVNFCLWTGPLLFYMYLIKNKQSSSSDHTPRKKYDRSSKIKKICKA